jgi:hypothetical protein
MKRLCVILSVILVGLAPSCQRSAQGPTIRLEAAPGFRLADFGVVGYLGLGKVVAADEAINLMEPLFEEYLLGMAGTTVVLPRSEVSRRARTQQVHALELEVRDFWRDAKKVDRFKLAALCDTLGIDGVVVGSVEDWERNKISWGAEGTSFTRVTVTLSLYASGEGRPVWRARCSEMMESEVYEPSTVTAGPLDPGAERVAKRSGSMDPGAQRAQKATPEPPPFEDVGRVVAAALVQALSG